MSNYSATSSVHELHHSMRTESITMLARRWLERNAGWMLIFACVLLLPFGTSYNAPMTIMAVAGLWRLIRDPALLDDTRVRLIGVLFLCIWLPMVISLIGSVETDRAVRTVLAFLRFPFAGVFVICVLRDEMARRRLLWALFALICVWSLDGLTQWTTGRSLFGAPYDGVHLTGIFHPNRSIGLFMATMSPIYFEIVRTIARRQPLAWLLVLPCILVVFLGGTRTAWILLAVAAVVWGLWVYYSSTSRHRHRIALALVILVAASVPVLLNLPGMEERVERSALILKGDYESIDEALTYRLPIWTVAAYITKDHWLTGVGPRGYRYLYVEYANEYIPPERFDGRSITHPHMTLLEIASETGVIGVAGYVIFAVILIVALRRYVTRETMPWAIATIIVFFPLNTYKALYSTEWSHLAWLLLIVTVALLMTRSRAADELPGDRAASRESRKPPAPSRKPAEAMA